MNSPPPQIVFNKKLTLKFESATSCKGKRRERISCTSLGLSLRQECRFQRSVFYLNFVGRYFYLFTRCFCCVDLRKKLSSLKQYSVKYFLYVKVTILYFLAFNNFTLATWDMFARRNNYIMQTISKRFHSKKGDDNYMYVLFICW